MPPSPSQIERRERKQRAFWYSYFSKRRHIYKMPPYQYDGPANGKAYYIGWWKKQREMGLRRMANKTDKPETRKDRHTKALLRERREYNHKLDDYLAKERREVDAAFRKRQAEDEAWRREGLKLQRQAEAMAPTFHLNPYRAHNARRRAYYGPEQQRLFAEQVGREWEAHVDAEIERRVQEAERQYQAVQQLDIDMPPVGAPAPIPLEQLRVEALEAALLNGQVEAAAVNELQGVLSMQPPAASQWAFSPVLVPETPSPKPSRTPLVLDDITPSVKEKRVMAGVSVQEQRYYRQLAEDLASVMKDTPQSSVPPTGEEEEEDEL